QRCRKPEEIQAAFDQLQLELSFEIDESLTRTRQQLLENFDDEVREKLRVCEGITEAAKWKGGGGFRYYRLAPSLLEKDEFGNWVISKEYNPAMLAEAMCKLE